MTVFRFHSEPMQDSWADAYGHLNEAYYLVPLSNTTWKMQDHFGIGTDYFDKTGCAIYTVETHLRYLNDVRAPATMEIETLMLGSDAKKIWFAHQMRVDGDLCATAEFMTLFYENWIGGDDVRTAFNKTQKTMQQRYKDEPLKWAAFVLFE